jgi:hypothetical protein
LRCSNENSEAPITSSLYYIAKNEQKEETKQALTKKGQFSRQIYTFFKVALYQMSLHFEQSVSITHLINVFFSHRLSVDVR